MDSNEINDNIQNMLENVHNKSNNNEIDDLKTLELAKIIVKELLNVDKNVKSLSILNQEQIEDITNAYLLNSYYKIPDIDEYVKNFLELKRSTGGYLIDKISSLSTNSNEFEQDGHKSFLNRVFKR